MRYEQPSTDDGTERLDSDSGESGRATEQIRDERELYGEPRHEVDAGHDEETLYGEPQHETESSEASDLDLLFVWTRGDSFAGPTATQSGESRPAGTTER